MFNIFIILLLILIILIYYINQQRDLRATDSCYPGITIENHKCKCPEKVKKNNKWISFVNMTPICIRAPCNSNCIQDPCNPNGYFNGIKCVCNPGNIAIQDNDSYVKWVCKSS